MDHWFEILSIRVRYPPIQQGIVTIYAKACKKKKKNLDWSRARLSAPRACDECFYR